MGNNEVVDLAWLGGFIDGEGYLGITKSIKRDRKKLRFALSPTIAIYNTKREIMTWISETYGFRIKVYSRDRRPQYRDEYHCRISGLENQFKFLRSILPYLKLKRKQAELLIEFIELRLSVDYRHTPYQERCFEIYEELKKLNRKGRECQR